MRRVWEGAVARGRDVARGDVGMTTAEYAVGTVAACGFGGILYKILTSDTVFNLIGGLISKALHFGF